MPSCPQCRAKYATGVHLCPVDGAVLLPDVVLETSELTAGVTVGEYVVEAKLGEGGFGIVFRAVQPLIGKQVAIKVLNRQCSADPAMVSRFVSEARAVNQIRHQNIIDIFSFGQLPDGRHYYVMELLDGVPLDRYLASRGRLSLAEALPILRPLARALEAAHAKGITHRDLKPENIFVARDADGAPFPKLLDFGIAKLLQPDGPVQHKTVTGAAMGTPHYMSPEQCRGRDVDHRADTYAFGIILYQLLTGRLPFNGQGFMEIAFKHSVEVPAPPSKHVPGLPPALDAQVLAFLEKEPDKRPQSIVAAVRAIEELAATVGDVPSVTPSTPNTAPNPQFATAPTLAPGDVPTQVRSRRAPVKWLAAGGALVAAAVVAFVALRPDASAPPPEEPVVVAVTGSAAAPATEPPASDSPATPPPASEPLPERAEPPPPATVTITVQGPPPGTEIFGPGGVALGVAPGTLLLPRGTSPVRIELRARGHRPRFHELTPLADGTLTLELEPERRPAPAKKPPAPKKPAKDDLEDAFADP